MMSSNNSNNQDLSIISVNCRGLSDSKKRKDVFDYLKKKKCNIYCLQDVNFTTEKENYIKAEWGFDIVYSSYSSNSRGVSILFNNNFEFTLHNTFRDDKGNFIALDLNIENCRVTLINIYGPNEDNPKFYDTITEIIEKFNNKETIICGDFNLVQSFELYTFNYIKVNNPKAREKILDIKETMNLVDPFRHFFPEVKRYTWRKKRPLKQSRLDFFLVSQNFI